jgi:acyl-CoA hydrolase
MAESQTGLAEIVGEEALHGRRMQAGAILDLMDVTAGRVASTHCSAPVVTLAFDRVDLAQPILHGDLIRLEGRLAWVGRSSMMIEVEVFRQDILIRDSIPVQRSFVTMVAVDPERRPKRDIPGLLLDTADSRAANARALRQRGVAQAWLEMQAEPRPQPPRVEDVEEAFNRDKREYLSPAETVVRVCRTFMPRHMNLHGTVFGGDILLWMDRAATYCARHFTRSWDMVTLAMNHILFREPILTTDLVEMTARVVYVRHYTLEVEISVTLQRLDGTRALSHSGYFTVLNYDEAGFKRPIVTGLRLSADDPESLLRYSQARSRHRFWKERQEGGGVPR